MSVEGAEINPNVQAKFKVLSLLHISNDGFLASLPLLLPFIKTSLDLSLTQVGFLGSVLNVMSAALALPAAYISAKIGGLRALILALGIYSLGFIGVSLSSNYVMVLLSFFVASTGFGIFHPIGLALIAKWYPKAIRGRHMGNFTAIGDIGRISLAACVTLIASQLGWRASGALYGAIGLGAWLIFEKFHIRDTDHLIDHPPQVAGFRYLLRHPEFMLTTVIAGIDAFASFSLLVFLPFLLLEKGMDPAVLGAYTGVFFAGHFIGKAVIGRLVDYVGNLRVFVVAELCMAMVIIALTVSNHWLTIIASFLALGALTKGTIPALTTMVAESAEESGAYDKAFALNSLTVSVACTIAPTLYGYIADRMGVTQVFTICAAVAVMTTVPAGILYLVRAKKQRVV